MAVGLGIHGEPGIDETDVPTADELAELFVSRLLDEVPAGVDVSGARVVPILNGLGSVKYEELFVVYRGVDRLLARRRRRGRRSRGRRVLHELRHGRVLADPAVAGRRAGAALDRARGHARLPRAARSRSGSASTPARPQAAQRTIPPASAESREAATVIAGLLARMAEAIDEHADELGRMDSVAGDGDHGIGMQRGSRAGANGGPVGRRGRRGRRHDAGRGRRRLVRPGRRHLRRDLGADPADPRPGAGRRRAGGRGRRCRRPSCRPRTS